MNSVTEQDASLSIAGQRFRDSLDAELWPRGVPWKATVQPGRIDFWRCHAHALDRLGGLLVALLPDGSCRGSYWIGRHPNHPYAIAVCLLCGAWDEPETGLGGRDLVSLTAHLGGIGQVQAARWLADWAGISVRRHG